MPDRHNSWDMLALCGRLIFAGIFGMGLFFKLVGPAATSAYIAAAGFPMPDVLTWLAILFEAALVSCLLTGAWFRPACLAAGAYVIFLAFSFHGPSHWAGNEAEFGFFVDHFSFLAGLLFAAAYGPGRWSLRLGASRRATSE